MHIHHRVAQESDVSILLALIREFYVYDRHPYDEQRTPEALGGILRDPSLGCVWLIEAHGKAVGYVVLTLGYSLEYHGRDAFIDEIYIREAYRGQGIGDRTLQFVEAEARKLGVHALHLEVETENQRAHRFYLKHGFEEQVSRFMSKWIASDRTRRDESNR
jgi:ribosomal protein S18 acetylase RimI-like enzyme